MKTSSLISILLISFLGFNWGCKNFKTSKVGKSYHNLAAHYNGYFNAREKLKETQNKLFVTQKDNYNDILPVFTLGDEATAKNLTSDCEDITKKATFTIKKHDLSKWVDDCYFVIAKAYFLKRDYFAAIETFEFLHDKYPKTRLGQESLIWIALSRIQLKKPQEALAQIGTIERTKDFPVELKPFLNLTEAQYYIGSGEYKLAIERLKLAIPSIKKKNEKTRYYFILAQLQQSLNQNNEAAINYKEVIKRNPAYELAFQAKMGLAATDADTKSVKKYLLGLLKDDKNIAYYDQIYYVLARIEQRENNIPLAIKYLRLSVGNSKTNTNQKAKSYLLLGDIHFQLPVYVLAKNYYDSAAGIVTKDYPNYEKFKERQKVLVELISHLIIIDREDSLQRLALLPADKLDKYIDEMILKEKENKDTKTQLNNSFLSNNTEVDPNKSPWYDPLLTQQGIAKFKSQWGDRPLQDNWRFKTTSIVIKKDSIPETNDVVADRKKYYDPIPNTKSKLNWSNKQIEDALFAAGEIYFNKLNDNKKAAETLEELLKRFPDNSYLVKTYYDLYLIYTDLKETSKAETYKNMILISYPGSAEAKRLNNEAQVVTEKNVELEALYAGTFDAYQEGNCVKVQQNFLEANQSFSNNYLKAKMDYLKTLCANKDKGNSVLKDSLYSFAKRYPGNEMAKQATNLAKLLENRKEEEVKIKVDSVVKKEESSIYEMSDSTPHYYAIIIPKASPVNLVKMEYSDFNLNTYPDLKLEISSFNLGDNYVVLCGPLKNRKYAMDYYGIVSSNEELRAHLKLSNKTEVIISEKNFQTLMTQKEAETYIKFFKAKYLP